MMDYEDPFANLPEDPDLKFVVLEKIERQRLAAALEDAELEWFVRSNQFDYMNAVHACADALGISVLADYPILLTNDARFEENYATFSAHVKRVVLAIQLNKPFPTPEYSVAVSDEARVAIRHLIDEIKKIIDGLRLTEIKKNSLLHHLNEFAADVDRIRTRFDIAMRMTLAVVSTANECVEEIEPPQAKLLRRLVEKIGDLLGTEKSKEDARALPPGAERVKLPGAPKMITGPKEEPVVEFGDEIPF